MHSIIRATLSTVPRRSTTTAIITTFALPSTSSVQPATSESSKLTSWELSRTPIDICWLSPDCRAVLTNISTCYDISGQMPTPSAEQSLSYQNCPCNSQGGYEQSVSPSYKAHNYSSYPITNCLLCMQQAGVNIWSPKLPTQQMHYKIIDFCSSARPNFINMSMSVLPWIQHIKPPDSIGLPPKMSLLLSTIAQQFTETLKSTTTVVAPPGSTDVPLSWWQSSLAAIAAIPSEYLAQLPLNWPYTRYAVARRGLREQTTSYALTNPNATKAETVAWVYASLLWNPRSLFTPSAERNSALNASLGLYQPLLANWTQALLPLARPVSTTMATTETTATTATTVTLQATPASLTSSMAGYDVSNLAQPRQTLVYAVSTTTTNYLSDGAVTTGVQGGGNVHVVTTTTTSSASSSSWSSGRGDGVADDFSRMCSELQSLRSRFASA
ncbi:hypothetical protein J1614_008195, partial [Plenodomus biglobosus]